MDTLTVSAFVFVIVKKSCRRVLFGFFPTRLGARPLAEVLPPVICPPIDTHNPITSSAYVCDSKCE